MTKFGMTLALAILAAHPEALRAQGVPRMPTNPGPPERAPGAPAAKPAPPPAAKPERRHPVVYVDGYNAFEDRYGYPQPQTGGYVLEPIPPGRPDVQGPAPGPAMAWIPGYYRWNGAFTYVEGHWVSLPGGYHDWIPGRWATNDLGNYWVPGYWH